MRKSPISQDVEALKTVTARSLRAICGGSVVILGLLGATSPVEAQTDALNGPVDRIWLVHRTADQPGFAEGDWGISMVISSRSDDMEGAEYTCHARNLRQNFNERQPGQGDVYEISVARDCERGTSGSPLALKVKHMTDNNIRLRNIGGNIWLPDSIFVIVTTRSGTSELRVAKTEWNCWFGPPNKRQNQRDLPARAEWWLDDTMCD